MGKIHNEFKLKLFEGIVDNQNDGEPANESLDLNFANEKNLAQSNHYTRKAPQNEVNF